MINKKTISIRKLSLILVVGFVLLLVLSFASAKSFTVHNTTNESQPYFSVNGTTGNIGVGTTAPTTLLQILNDRWISAKNYLGNGIVNMFKVNANDQIELGATLNIGNFEFDEDSGLVTLVDMPVSSTPSAGTSESYVFKVDGDNIMTVYSEADGSGGIQNKRVGIGTTSPNDNLHISGATPILRVSSIDTSTNAGIIIGKDNLLSGFGAKLWNNNNNGDTYLENLWDNAAADIFLRTRGVDRLAIDADGNIGIGTIIPQRGLHVTSDILSNATINATGDICIEGGNCLSAMSAETGNVSGSGAANRAAFWTGTDTLSYDGNFTWDNTNKRLGIGTATPSNILDLGETFGGSVGAAAGKKLAVYQSASGVNFYGLGIASGTLEFHADSTSTELPQMVLKSSGNVGIGITSPDSLLEVNGSFKVTNASNDAVILYANQTTGKVGIGTTAPEALLNAVATGGTDSKMIFDGGTSANALLIAKADTDVKNPQIYVQDSDLTVDTGAAGFLLDRASPLYTEQNDMLIANFIQDKDIHFVTDDGGSKAVRFSILDSGNVGINTTNPQNTLNVIGEGNFTTGVTIPNDQTYKMGGDDFIKYWATNNSVAVGKSAGADTQYSSYLGNYAGRYNTGSHLVAMGYSAGYNNSGDFVVSIGTRANEHNSQAGLTSVGYEAGEDSSGGSSTMIGYKSGKQNTGTSLTATGYYTGYNNTGNYVTASGYEAGRDNIGNYTSFYGYEAGEDNTGTGVTALGYEAGYNNTGTYVTATGYQAGQSNTGIHATATGYLAGSSNTGGYLVATGVGAGYLNTGEKLIATGYNAGRQNTGNQVIGIGYEAARNNTASDVVAIGYEAGKDNTVADQFIVKQANVNPIPLIQGNFSSGYVGIGTETPQNTLNVVGDINATGNISAGEGSPFLDIYYNGSYVVFNSINTNYFTRGITVNGTLNADSIYSGGSSVLTSESDPIFVAWDNFTGIPHATPSNGDVTHFSLADEIYDWVTGLGYLTSYTETDPYWSDNFTKYNDSWTTTNTEIWNVIDNSTFAYINEPLWSANYTAYNDSWSSTYNATYDTWAYNQTTPAINTILGWDYYNSTIFDYNDYYLKSNPFTFWNDTYATFNKTYADTLYSTIDEPLWSANYTAYNDSWTTTDAEIQAAEIDPFWSGNYTAYNDSWTTTDSEIWAVVDNDTFALISEPLWSANYTAYNDSWSSTYNASYVPYTGATQNVDLGGNNFTVNVTTLHVDVNTGRVGIGTTSPGSPLYVSSHTAPQITAYGDNNGGILATDRSSSSAGGSGIQFKSAGSVQGYLILPSNDDNTIRIQDSGGQQVIDFELDNKRVGIGTITPQRALHVTGDILSNATINATGDVCIEGGNCLSNVVASESDPLWSGNWTKYNDSWTTTDSEIWAVVDNDTFALISEPLWSANYTAYNDSWSSIVNESYYLKTNPYTFWNDTYATFNETYADTLYSTIDEPLWTANYTMWNTTWSTDTTYSHLTNFTDDLGDRGYTHLTNFTDDILWTTGFNATGDSRWLGVGGETDPLWSGNWTNVAFTNIDETFDENLVVTKNFTVDTDTLFVDSDTEMVGIGTSSPSKTFVVNSSGSDDGIILINAAGTTLGQISETGTDAGYLTLQDGGSAKIQFNANNGQDSYINNSGNFGIGTRSPNYRLDIEGVEGTELLLRMTSTASNTEAYTQWKQNDGDALNIGVSTDANSYSYISSVVNPLRFYVSGGPHMTILTDGKVGIATSTPQNTLNVVGDGNFTGNLTVGGNSTVETDICIEGGNCLSNTGGTGTLTGGGTYGYVPMWNGTTSLNNSVVYQNGTNIGIGTASPTRKLQVEQATTGWTGWFENTNAEGAGVYIKGVSTLAEDTLLAVSANDGANVVLDVQADGHVGIGTTSPGSNRLSVIQDSTTDGSTAVFGSATGAISGTGYGGYFRKIGAGTTNVGLYASASGGTNNYGLIVEAGNVGINTTTPQNMLNVVGDGNFTGLIYGNGSQLTDLPPSSPIWTQDGSDIYYNESGGKVGVGTGSPGVSLEIGTKEGGDYGNLFVKSADADGFAIHIEESSGNEGWMFGVNATGDLNFFNSGAIPAVITFSDDNRVGIGTASPSTLLDLYTNGADLEIRMEEDAGTHDVRTHYRRGGVDWYTGLIGSANFQIVYSLGEGGELEPFTILESGNVGIGTTSPDRQFHIKEPTGDGEMIIQAKQTSGYTRAKLIMSIASTADIDVGTDKGRRIEIQAIPSGTWGVTPRIGFFTSDNISNVPTEKMSIMADGNVGIGTVSPDVRVGQKLDIATTDDYGGMSLSTWSTVNTDGSIFDFKKSGHATIGTHAAVADNERLGIITFRGSDGVEFLDAASIRAEVDGAVTGGGTNDMPGRLMFYTTADGEYAVTERMRIDSAGNVGIGTTSPYNPLQVHTRSGAFEYSNFALATWDGTNQKGVAIGHTTNPNSIQGRSGATGGTNDDLLLNPYGGKVGIGTASPDNPLEIESSANAHEGLHIFKSDANDYDPRIKLSDAGAYWLLYMDRDDSDKFKLHSGSGGNALTIQHDGNVGIGDTSPGRKLVVDDEGDGEILRLSYANATNAETLIGFSYRDHNSAANPPVMLGYKIDSDGWTGQSKGAIVFKTRSVTTDTAPTTRMTIDSAGDVGIGTTTPQNTLNVVGDANITGLIYGNGSQLTDISQAESDPKWTANWTADQYLFNTGDTASGTYNFDSNTLVVDAPDNRVGIGTASPTSNLHIYDSAGGATLIVEGNAGAATLALDSGGGAHDSTIVYRDDNTAKWMHKYESADDSLKFYGYTLGDYVMSMEADGKVGIGTVAPGAKLEVVDTGALILDLRRDGTGANWGSLIRFKLDDSGGNIETFARIMGVIEDNTDGAEDGYLRFDTTLAGDDTDEKMRITSDGNVGIGTVTPGAYRLYVAGGSGIQAYNTGADSQIMVHEDAGTHDAKLRFRRGGYDYYMGFIGGNTFQIYYETIPVMTIDNAGQVGIGETAPDTALEVKGAHVANTGVAHIAGTTHAYMEMDAASDASQSGFYFSEAGTPQMMMRFNGVANAIDFYDVSATATRFTIEETGDVGIGTASPANALHIYKDLGAPSDLGDFGEYQLIVQTGATTGGTSGILLSSSIDTYGGSAIVHYDTDAGGKGDLAFYTKQGTTAIPPVEVMRLDDAGNVGIGDSTPTYKLDVAGTGRFTGDLTVGGNDIYSGQQGTDNKRAYFYLEVKQGANFCVWTTSCVNPSLSYPSCDSGDVVGETDYEIDTVCTGIAEQFCEDTVAYNAYRSCADLKIA